MRIKNILLDTDIGPDCDDVAAVALLNLYADAGLCNILGIGHCTSNPYGAGAVDAICRYYGRPDVQIGTFSGKGFLTDEKCMIYNRKLTMTLPNRYRETHPEDAVKMYRRILSEQPDASVDFISIGPMNNLSDLLNSEPDRYSALSGIELVRKKVIRLVAMAGIFRCASETLCQKAKEITGREIEDTREYNVVCDIPAAQNVASNWPTPKEYFGFEAGLLETGGPLQKHPDANHPVKLAYKLYTEDGNRYSWDPLTVEYAIVPDCRHYQKSVPGTVYFDDLGRTRWEASDDGNDCYVEWAQPADVIAKDINLLFMSR